MKEIWEEFGMTKKEWDSLPDYRRKQLFYSYQVAKASGRSPGDIEQEVANLIKRSAEKLVEKVAGSEKKPFVIGDKTKSQLQSELKRYIKEPFILSKGTRRDVKWVEVKPKSPYILFSKETTDNLKRLGFKANRVLPFIYEFTESRLESRLNY
jgi:hypothetical protein